MLTEIESFIFLHVLYFQSSTFIAWSVGKEVDDTKLCVFCFQSSSFSAGQWEKRLMTPNCVCVCVCVYVCVCVHIFSHVHTHTYIIYSVDTSSAIVEAGTECYRVLQVTNKLVNLL